MSATNLTTDLNHLASPLLRLSAEIRNQITGYVLDVDKLVEIDTMSRKHAETTWRGQITHISELLPLTMACRQLRAETQVRLLQNNKLIVSRYSNGVQRLPPSVRASITELRVDLTNFPAPAYMKKEFWNAWVELDELPKLEKVVVIGREWSFRQPIEYLSVTRRATVAESGAEGKLGNWHNHDWDIEHILGPQAAGSR